MIEPFNVDSSRSGLIAISWDPILRFPGGERFAIEVNQVCFLFLIENW